MALQDLLDLSQQRKKVGLSEERVNAIMANIVDGRIILTHDVDANAEAYSITIPRIYEMGYKIVTISELIKLRGYSAPAGSSYWEFP